MASKRHIFMKSPTASQTQPEQVSVPSAWGYALTEVLMGITPDFEKRAMRSYYEDPSDPFHHWSGAGEKPDWVRQWEREGRSLEELFVRPRH